MLQQVQSYFSKPKSTVFLPSHYVFFDLETTGINAEKNSIIEIGAIRVDARTGDCAGFQTLVNHGRKVSRQITQITGITTAMLQGRPTIEQALPGFMEFVGDLPLVAYNASFDMRFLAASARKSGIEVANLSICALKLAKLRFPGLESYKLGEVARSLDLEVGATHRALSDCFLGIQLYERCRKS